jgi:hypothetical protein
MLKSFMICTDIMKNKIGWKCSTQGERSGAYMVLLWKPEKKQLKVLSAGGVVILSCNGVAWTGFVWLGRGTSGGVL